MQRVLASGCFVDTVLRACRKMGLQFSCRFDFKKHDLTKSAEAGGPTLVHFGRPMGIQSVASAAASSDGNQKQASSAERRGPSACQGRGSGKFRRVQSRHRD